MKKKIIKYTKRYLVKIFKFLYRLTYQLIPVDPNLVVFIAYHGRGCVGNPKYIFNAMLKDPRFKNMRKVWMIKHANKCIIENAKVVTYNSPRYFFYMARSKYWIVNCKLPAYILKKEKQVYLQTWHGTPLKRLAHDIDIGEDATFYRSNMSYEQMVKSYDDDVCKYNYMIAPNEFCFEVFQSAFRIDAKRLIKTGYPRNDFLINNRDNECYIQQLKNKYQIPLDKKVLLYAPTWRDNSYNNKGYTVDLKIDQKLWEEYLKDEYIVLFKPHYLIVSDNIEANDFLYKLDSDVDINELYLISDALVTDYSSVFFDFANLNKPIYFYMFDLQDYADNLRGFYLDIYQDLPGSVYESEAEMLDDIKNGRFDYERLKVFNQRFNTYEDGLASKKVVELIAERRD